MDDGKFESVEKLDIKQEFNMFVVVSLKICISFVPSQLTHVTTYETDATKTLLDLHPRSQRTKQA